MHGVFSDGVWVGELGLLKEDFWSFFQSRFSQQIRPQPKTNASHFSTLPDSLIQFIRASFSRDEIKRAV